MPLEKFYQNNWRGGVVTNVTNEALNDEELVDLINFDYDSRGRLIRRLGYEQVFHPYNGIEVIEINSVHDFPDPYSNGNMSKIFKMDGTYYKFDNIVGDYLEYLPIIQGVFDFKARPYVADSIDDLNKFDKHLVPLNDYGTFNSQLISINGRLKVLSTNSDIRNIKYIKNAVTDTNVSKSKTTFKNVSLTMHNTDREVLSPVLNKVENKISYISGGFNSISGRFAQYIQAKAILEIDGEFYPTYDNIYNYTSGVINQYVNKYSVANDVDKIPLSFKVERQLGDGKHGMNNHSETINYKFYHSGQLREITVEIYYPINVTNQRTKMHNDILYTYSETVSRKLKVTENGNVIFDNYIDNTDNGNLILDGVGASDNTDTYSHLRNKTLNYNVIANFYVSDNQLCLNLNIDDFIYANYKENGIRKNDTIKKSMAKTFYFNYNKILNPVLEIGMNQTNHYSSLYTANGYNPITSDIKNISYGFMTKALSISLNTITHKVSALDEIYSGYQGENLIEATQIRNDFFIATGTKLVMLRYVTVKNGNSGDLYLVAKNVEDVGHIPNTQEALIGGINLIRDYDYLSEIDFTNSLTLGVREIRIEKQKGISGKENRLKASLNLRNFDDINSFTFNWKIKESNSDNTFVDLEEYAFCNHSTNGESLRDILLTINKPGVFDIELTLTDASGETKKGYLFGYEVLNYELNNIGAIKDVRNEINKCTKVIQYNGKLIVYGNGTSNIYKTFSTYPTWFTVNGVIPFNNTKQEPLNVLVPLDNALVGFTDNTIIALIGKGDDIQLDGYPFEPFSRFINVSDNIGCIAPESVAKIDGQLLFLSYDGIKILNSLSLDSEVAKPLSIDENIKNIVPKDINACGVVYSNTYYLCYPDRNWAIKWHLPNKQFSFDKSDEYNFVRMWVSETDLYAINLKGNLLRRMKLPIVESKIDDATLSNKGYFKDVNTVYEARLETKYNGFGYDPYLKKIMEVMIGFNSVRDDIVKFTIDVIVDNINILDSVQKRFILERDENSEYFIYAENQETNIIGNVEVNALSNEYSTIGQVMLNKTNVNFIRQTFRFMEFERTVEGFMSKIIITHKQDNLFTLNSIGIIYDLGYIPRNINGHFRL